MQLLWLSAAAARAFVSTSDFNLLYEWGSYIQLATAVLCKQRCKDCPNSPTTLLAVAAFPYMQATIK